MVPIKVEMETKTKKTKIPRTKVLVTGATGFLGRHLTCHLLEKNLEVSILARKSSDIDFVKNQPVNVIHGDITDPCSLVHATENKNVVYHLAGLIAYKKEDRGLMDQINVQGTANVLNACIKNKVSKVVHLSSVAAIGASFKPEFIDENFEYNLEKYNLGYFQTKHEAENLVIKAFRENGLQTYLINPSTIYGKGDATKSSRKVQKKVAQGRFPFYPPGGVNVVHVADVIKAIDLCLEKGKPARRYIIGGENMTIRELFYQIADIAGVKPPNIGLPKFLLGGMGFVGDLMNWFSIKSSWSGEKATIASLYHWFSIQRARKELGFNPQPARKALEESVLWMMEEEKLRIL